jgi:hypothetical protein
MPAETLVDDPMGIECIGGPHDGRRLKRVIRRDQIGDPENVGGSVYVWQWWPYFDEQGDEVGARKVLAYPGTRFPACFDHPPLTGPQP